MNYHSFTTPVDHIYVVTDKNLYRQPNAMKGDRSRRDVKKNYAFHKDTGHSTQRWGPLRMKSKDS